MPFPCFSFPSNTITPQRFAEAESLVEGAYEFAAKELESEARAVRTMREQEKRIKEIQHQLKENERKAQLETNRADKMDAEDTLRGILAEAQADKQEVQKTLLNDRDRQKQRLQERLAARSKKGQIEAKRQRDQEIKEEKARVQAAQKLAGLELQKGKIEKALARLPPGDRETKGKDVIEMLLRSRFNKENEKQLREQFESRSNYFQQLLGAESDPDYAAVEQQVLSISPPVLPSSRYCFLHTLPAWFDL